MADEQNVDSGQEQGATPELSPQDVLTLIDKYSADETFTKALDARFNPLNQITDVSDVGKLVNSHNLLASFVDSSKSKFYKDQLEKNKDQLFHDWNLEKNPTDDPALKEAQRARQLAEKSALEAYAFRKANRFDLQETDIENWILPIAKSTDDVDRLAESLKSRFAFNEQEVRKDERLRISKVNGVDLKPSNPDNTQSIPTFTRDELAKMSYSEKVRRYDDIKAAEKAGKIT